MKTQNRYSSLYERLVANTILEVEDNPQSCWLWTGSTAGDSEYPRIAIRVPGKPHPINKAAHRVMLEEVYDVDFPFDEAGHLCGNPRCVSPMHLEIQAPAHNAAERCCGRQWSGDHRWIPILFPRPDHPDFDPDPWAGEPAPADGSIPF